MITLLSDRFAPITSRFGFLEVPLEVAAAGLGVWRQQLHGRAKAEPVGGSLAEMLERLPPLTGGVRPRELLVGTVGDRWTAYFDCGFQGTDAVSTVGYLAEELKCQGLAIDSTPHTFGTGLETPGRYGAVQFELFGPLQTDFLNYVRTISAAHDGSRWSFEANGTVQAFEDPDRYEARRVRDKFTSEMLAEYAAELGVRPFDEDFYADQGILIESRQKVPRKGKSMSLADTQHYWGIVPGIADRVPG
ncbi:hypothetical protein GCM10029976_038490 [Kribbella albertanoniae]|uniref:Uncharacterized protein n=1 Tax=Kribbella albertanoniae TaxID=1266829 RepID=A0A4R4PQE8_9ACTN|nr:hypothetical protein [Kribbella albertanoniae]TDC24510.1 hypothetical protein E1261_26095 [Kribbella albertanoniae]